MSESDWSADQSPVCPYCGHHTLYKVDGWVEGGPMSCANPMCDSNHPPDQDEESETR